MRILIIILFVFVSRISLAQIIHATTENGKKVILNNNGSWKYDVENNLPENKSDNIDCSNWIIKQEDKVSGSSVLTMKNPIIVSQDGGENGLIIRLVFSSNTIILNIIANGAGRCIDKNAKINILFKDGSRMELLNESDFNCKGSATIYFGGIFGKKNKLIDFKNKNIETIRVWTSDSYVQETLDEEQSMNFRSALNCLSK